MTEKQIKAIRELIKTVEETKSARVVVDYAFMLMDDVSIKEWDEVVNNEFKKYDKL